MATGLRYLARHGWLREAAVRVLVPLDPIRYVELPETLRELAVRPGERVLDLASPKLAALRLARTGAEVVSVDLLESEVASWRKLTAHEPRLRLEVADGRRLPFEDGAFDHAYSISVLEHIPDEGDLATLAELARVVRPGGRVVLTLPYSPVYSEEWRDRAVYGDDGNGADGYFFARAYDAERLERLLRAAPSLTTRDRLVARLVPASLDQFWMRTFPLLVPLAPFFGLVFRGREASQGFIRLTLVKRG